MKVAIVTIRRGKVGASILHPLSKRRNDLHIFDILLCLYSCAHYIDLASYHSATSRNNSVPSQAEVISFERRYVAAIVYWTAAINLFILLPHKRVLIHSQCLGRRGSKRNCSLMISLLFLFDLMIEVPVILKQSILQREYSASLLLSIGVSIVQLGFSSLRDWQLRMNISLDL